MKIKVIHIILILCLVTILSCNDISGLQENELGFAFKRCTKHNTSPKATEGDVIFGEMKILLNNKTLIYSSYGSPERLFVVGKSEQGSIDEFLSTLHIADSAIIVVPADSVAQYTKNIEVKKEDKIHIYLTVSQIISRQDVSGHENEIQQRMLSENEMLTEYVLEHFARAEKKESGLFFLSIKEGAGKNAEYGNLVSVYYAVTDTAGNLYDTNKEDIARKGGIFSAQRRYIPFSFMLGDDALIAGWSEGVSYMKEGGQAILIIPSYLAYGDYGFGKIPPYTPLVFEIWLTKIENYIR